jgi:hypothetical protein
MTKNALRKQRHWPQHGDIDCDYATGREFTGEWIPMPSTEQRDRFDAPIVGGPLYCVNQLDKALKAEEAR